MSETHDEANTQRTVLVTGGTGTIGAAIVQALASDNEYSVVANYAHDAARARELQQKTGCDLLCADVGDERQVVSMFESLSDLFAVIHVAAIVRDGLLLKQSKGEWDGTLRTNCDGAFLVVREALRELEDQGRLILFASRVGEQGRVGQTAYAASKAAVIALTKCAAREGAKRHIAVNAICPGFISSAMNEGLKTSALDMARQESVFGKSGGVKEVVSLVQLLLSENASDISGQVFHCDSRI